MESFESHKFQGLSGSKTNLFSSREEHASAVSLTGVTGAGDSPVGIKRELAVHMACRIHSLEINQPRPGTKILNQFPFPPKFRPER